MEAKATREAVFRLADAMHAVGVAPTIDLIVGQLGGSKSTVGPLLAEWRERQMGTPQAVQQAEVARAEQRLHELIQAQAHSTAVAQQRAAASEAEAQAARAAADVAELAAAEARRERDAALAAAAGAVSTAKEVTELRQLVLASTHDQRRARVTMAALHRQMAGLRARAPRVRR